LLVTLDYRNCGSDGEPSVVHVETEASAPKITFLAENFQAFIDELKEESAFDV